METKRAGRLGATCDFLVRSPLSVAAVVAAVLLAGWQWERSRVSRDRLALRESIAQLAPGRRGDPQAPCGAVCATVAARILNRPLQLKVAVAAVPSDPLGRTSMAELVSGVRSLGLAAEALELSTTALRTIHQPVVLHVAESHFLVAITDGGGAVVLIDPPHAPRLVSLGALRAVWNGNCVLVASDESELDERLCKLRLQ